MQYFQETLPSIQ